MADVRCPMCGKPNPEEADTCQYCQARLKPLNISPFSSSNDEEVPEWLRGLRMPDVPGDEEAESPTSGAEESDIPDWLSRLGGQESQGDKETPTFSFSEEESKEEPAAETPDWLSGLSGGEADRAFSFGEPEQPAPAQPAEEPAAVPPAVPADETPDWLSGLSGSQGSAFSFDEPVESAGEEPAAEPPAEPAAEKPDWLSSLGVSQEPTFSFGEPEQPAAEEPAAEPAAETPDWLSGLTGSQEPTFSFGEPEQPAPAEPAAELAAETPDWLSSLGENQEPAFSFGEPEQPAPAEPTEEPAAEPPAELAAETPDWLSGLGSGHEQPFTFDDLEEPSAESAAVPTAETPDWLSSLAGDSQENTFASMAPEEAVPEGAAEPADGLPDWLSSLTGSNQPGEAAFSSPASEGSDWFAQQQAQPDWLSQQPAEPAAEAAEAEENGQIPDWLSDTTEAAGAFAFGASQAENEPAGEQPAEPAEALPEWLSRLDKTSQPAGFTSSVPAFTMDEGEEAFSEEPSAAGESGLQMGVPDWISQVSAESVQEAAPAPGEGEAESNLAQADLPDWLEAMRPVEAASGAPGEAFHDTSDDRLEKAGPLAGLRGVLPAETAGLQMHKPSAYTLKVSVPDEQQQRMNMLQELLAGEGQPVPMPSRAALSSQLVLRLLVFALLVVASVVALWNGPLTPLPDPAQTALEVREAERLVAGLPSGAPVLVALDYEPGFSDEMDAMVRPVVDHLKSKGATLTFASTSPAGPILAASLVEKSGYTQFANLGFIPGGANGLMAFASAPAQTLPLELSGSPAWDGSPLSASQGLASFKLAVLATDDTDVARAWVEQAAPLLQASNVPLVVLTSAQTGPVLQPYFAASPRTVNGLVSGLAGGAAYQSLSGASGVAQQYWDPFVLATNVTVVFIVLGGLFSLVMGSLPQRKPAKGEEKA